MREPDNDPPDSPPVVPNTEWADVALRSVFPGRCRWYRRRHRWAPVYGLPTYRECMRCGRLWVVIDPGLLRRMRDID